MRIAPLLTVILSLACVPRATSQTTDSGPREIDTCGVLVRGAGCAIFEGGGGRFVITDTGRFTFGDAVRVVGTVDPLCITICGDVDGCVRGAILYDPAIYPCGTRLPDFPGDIVTGVCSQVGTGLVFATLAGLWLTRIQSPAKFGRPGEWNGRPPQYGRYN